MFGLALNSLCFRQASILQPPASASGGAGIIDLHHQVWLLLALVFDFRASKAFRFLLSTSCLVMTVFCKSEQVRLKQPIINLTPSQWGSNAPRRSALLLKQNLSDSCVQCCCRGSRTVPHMHACKSMLEYVRVHTHRHTHTHQFLNECVCSKNMALSFSPNLNPKEMKASHHCTPRLVLKRQSEREIYGEGTNRERMPPWDSLLQTILSFH